MASNNGNEISFKDQNSFNENEVNDSKVDKQFTGCDNKNIQLKEDESFDQKNSSVASEPGSTRNDSESEVNFTPFKENTSINLFKRGILCSSTPVPPAKKFKIEFDQLSVIEEVDNSTDEESRNITVVSNKLVNPIEKELVSRSDSAGDSKAGATTPLLITKENPEAVDNGNETVLHKDELSMLIEMPENQMVTVIEKLEKSEKTCSQKNNLTLNLDNNLSVTYKNIKEKTIDEIILANGNIVEDVKDIIDLDHEPDREKIIDKANNLQVFVSNDDAENKDNHDPEWELLRKLDTDDERYKAVRKIWKNLTIPDPKANLSAYNWRDKNSLEPLKNIQLPKPVPQNEALLNNNYPCTEVLDVAVENFRELYQGTRQGIEVDHNYEYSISLRKQPKNAINNNRNKNQLLLEELHSCFQDRLHKTQKAKEEIEAIHKFYNGLRNRDENSSNLLILNHCERQEVLDVENMITSYSQWYSK